MTVANSVVGVNREQWKPVLTTKILKTRTLCHQLKSYTTNKKQYLGRVVEILVKNCLPVFIYPFQHHKQ